MKPQHRAVRCSSCSKFLLNLEISADSMPVGNVVEIRDVRCKCGFVNHISVGIADKDTRSDADRIQDKLRQQLEEKEK